MEYAAVGVAFELLGTLLLVGRKVEYVDGVGLLREGLLARVVPKDSGVSPRKSSSVQSK